ncbi:MAG: exonuclease SbcCD subunit D [Bdellovibrionales bacterium]|nr:exonuclease SbcCD subunit D [Bdellovibrionales bacterium]
MNKPTTDQPIRLLHTSDWHLGKSIYMKPLIDDQEAVLTQFLTDIDIQIANGQKPDALLVAGDVFDRSIPPEDAVRRLDRFLDEVIGRRGVSVAMIPGNHDSATRVGANATLLKNSGLRLFSSPESMYEPLLIKSSSGSAAIYGIPYLEPAEWGFYFKQTITSHDAALAAILESLKPQLTADRAAGRRTVLLLHAFVAGGQASESERPLSIGGSELVAAERLGEFDYVALGHLHRPQRVASDRIRYSGSLFPYSASEAGSEKGYVAIELHRDRDSDRIEFSSFKTERSLRVLSGSFAELLKTPSFDDYVIVELTDSILPFEAFRRLTTVFPHLLHVGRRPADFATLGSNQPLALRSRHEERADHEVIGDFLKEATGDGCSDEEREWLISELSQFLNKEKERVP